MQSPILIESEETVRRIVLNRPERLNAIDQAGREALIGALSAAAADDAIRAVVITGAGDRAFCAGQDLNESRSLGEQSSTAWLESWRRFFLAFAEFPKPIVAAVNGVAAGGGFEIALLAHIRIAAPHARFLMAEIDVGLPCIVGSFLLESHVFFSRMVEILLSGRPFDARAAQAMGLVHRIVPRRRLNAAALAAARPLAEKPPVAMALNIRRFNEVRLARMARIGLEEALLRYQSAAIRCGEPQRAMNEFLARRASRRAETAMRGATGR